MFGIDSKSKGGRVTLVPSVASLGVSGENAEVIAAFAWVVNEPLQLVFVSGIMFLLFVLSHRRLPSTAVIHGYRRCFVVVQHPGDHYRLTWGFLAVPLSPCRLHLTEHIPIRLSFLGGRRPSNVPAIPTPYKPTNSSRFAASTFVFPSACISLFDDHASITSRMRLHGVRRCIGILRQCITSVRTERTPTDPTRLQFTICHTREIGVRCPTLDDLMSVVRIMYAISTREMPAERP